MLTKSETMTSFSFFPLAMALCGVPVALLPNACSLANDSLAPETLRVITYNVQFLPEPVSNRNERPNPEYRADRISEQVSRFDLIALQETFHNAHRQKILRGINDHWPDQLQSVTSPTPEGFFTSGGCLFVSRLPIATQHTKVFENYSKPRDYGIRADGHAAKGILHARVQRGSKNERDFVDVFVTHLEARDDDLRPLQYTEIAAFVRQHSSIDHPALLLGDLNTRGATQFRNDPQSQYSQLMKQLVSARSGGEWIDVWAYLQGDSLGGTTRQESSNVGKRIDYILLSNPEPPHTQLVPNAVEVKLFQDEEVTALSDHNAVAAELDWR